MGSFANTLFQILLGWIQGTASAVWSAFTSEDGSSFFSWIGRHWILLACILCIAGAVADFCVYIFRWKPFKVLKSYFTRKKATAEEPLYGIAGADNTQETETAKTEQNNSARIKPAFHTGQAQYTEPDLSYWETERDEDKRENNEAVQEPDMVTNAGYVVPADSPYRRPEKPVSAAENNEPDYAGSVPAEPDRGEPIPIAPRRRRRIKVSDLFNDPEEELRQFDAPQHVIDSRQAYHDPVYPHGWKKSEEDGE